MARDEAAGAAWGRAYTLAGGEAPARRAAVGRRGLFCPDSAAKSYN